MKKILMLLILLTISLTSISQTMFARAYSFTLGSRDYTTNELTWGETSTCNILIKLEGDVITVYSKQKQTYHVMIKLSETEDGIMYRMQSAKGITCNMYMGPIQGTTNVFIAIEFNDYAWIYNCIDETK